MTSYLVGCLLLVASLAAPANAQSTSTQAKVLTLKLAQDEVAVLKTAPGITTRLAFAEKVQDILCGDLYDPASGVGSFVVQRLGNEVFLKPVVSSGTSNMFVKVGDNAERTFNFDLVIGPVEQAYRIVKIVSVVDAADAQSPVSPSTSEQLRSMACPPLVNRVPGIPEQPGVAPIENLLGAPEESWLRYLYRLDCVVGGRMQ